MARIAIVTNSTSSLPPHLAEEYGIHVMPVYVIFGKRTFRDGMEARAGSAPAVHVSVLHAAASEEAEVLADQVASRFRCAELYTTEAGPIIGTHAGPGTLGLAFCIEG